MPFSWRKSAFCYEARVLASPQNHIIPTSYRFVTSNTSKVYATQILHQSYTLHPILHPILHPKSSVIAGGLIQGCRKCRFFPKTFFSEVCKVMFQQTQAPFNSPYTCNKSNVFVPFCAIPHPCLRDTEKRKGENWDVKEIKSNFASIVMSDINDFGKSDPNVWTSFQYF